MTLIKSISGIRGTIGGMVEDNLTPIDILKFTAAFAMLLRKEPSQQKLKIVVGRDARRSGEMVQQIVVGTLLGMGVDVIDAGLSTTPTVEMAVTQSGADGGIILTASHNPMQWNALKLLNHKGEFISAKEGEELIALSKKEAICFSPVEELGSIIMEKDFIEDHISAIMQLPLVDAEAVKKAGFAVVVDAINSTGAVAMPALLRRLGVENIEVLNEEMSGVFAHDPEPLPENIKALSQRVREGGADIGIVVDPDVDRLAFICENGEMFGEEYTLVAISKYVLEKTPGNTVSNLSSTQALKDITLALGCEYSPSAVGEVNVVEKMKETNAIIGGEGNGGVIYPELHYGRDAMVGVALFLTYLAKTGKTASQVRSELPNYVISKNKIELTSDIDVDALLAAIAQQYSEYPIHTTDGVKVEFGGEWVHLRKSNTEPIIRIYVESSSEESANLLAEKLKNDIFRIISE